MYLVSTYFCRFYLLFYQIFAKESLSRLERLRSSLTALATIDKKKRKEEKSSVAEDRETYAMYFFTRNLVAAECSRTLGEYLFKFCLIGWCQKTKANA